MELTNQEKDILLQLLPQISIPVGQAPLVLAIIEKLKESASSQIGEKML